MLGAGGRGAEATVLLEGRIRFTKNKYSQLYIIKLFKTQQYHFSRILLCERGSV